MTNNTVYLYLLSPLHTGGASQEGNLLGIARESHTDLPYIPSSTIRGGLRAATPTDNGLQKNLWGNTIEDLTKKDDSEAEADKNLTQGDLWIGDASMLWIPVPSLSHGVIWITSPLLLRRWARFNAPNAEIPADYSTNLASGKPVYLKDAILKSNKLTAWENWKQFLPQNKATGSIQKVLVLPDQHCATLVQMSLWRQVKIKLDSHKTVDGGFRYEEAIPPDTLMYFPWGMTSQAVAKTDSESKASFEQIIRVSEVVQIGGQESLGRGFVQQWLSETANINQEVAA